MRLTRRNSPWRIAARTLVVSVAGFGVATAAHADSRAAQKLGQMNVINQQFQPKPTRSSPGYSNSTGPNANANSSYNANGAANANGSNAATQASPPGAYPLKPNTK